MDIRELLEEDHQEAVRLARLMSATDDAAGAWAAYRALRAGLRAHALAEDAVVVAALAARGVAEAAAIARDGAIGHGFCDELLVQMAHRAAAGQTWVARAQVVCALLEHHVAAEQAQLFPLLERHFGAAERAQMAARFASRRRTLARVPVGYRPRAAPQPA